MKEESDPLVEKILNEAGNRPEFEALKKVVPKAKDYSESGLNSGETFFRIKTSTVAQARAVANKWMKEAGVQPKKEETFRVGGKYGGAVAATYHTWPSGDFTELTSARAGGYLFMYPTDMRDYKETKDRDRALKKDKSLRDKAKEILLANGFKENDLWTVLK